jgi:hypothetical protein
MTTLSDALSVQRQHGILQAPTIVPEIYAEAESGTPATTQIAIKNTTTSSNCWAYVTGLDINKNNAPMMIQADGRTVYYPASPAAPQAALAADCNIPLGPPGSVKNITIPQIAGGRIWLCKDSKLTFTLNPGPAIVEPAVTNTADPNYNLFWSFAEFTYDKTQMFANISYVDFVGMPVGMMLENTAGKVQKVQGIPANGLDSVCTKLQAQDNQDKAGWSKLIVKAPNGANLRALSPNCGMTGNPKLFEGYFQPYVASVWAKYATTDLSIDTQTQWGVVKGRVKGAELAFDGIGTFPQPSARDIFACDSGAFAARPTNNAQMGNLTARISAAFNRSTLLTNTVQPTKETIEGYYKDKVTNHYSRIVHEVVPDGRGYAFPYDDVKPNDNADVAGVVFDPNPKLLTIIFGGPDGSAKRTAAVSEFAGSGGRSRQQVGRKFHRRGLQYTAEPLPSVEEEKAALAEHYAQEDANDQQFIDLEKGQIRLPESPEEMALMARPLQSLIPATVQARVQTLLERLESNPAYQYARPALETIARLVVSLLQMSLQTLVSRGVVVLLLLLCSFLLGFFGRTGGTAVPVGDI